MSYTEPEMKIYHRAYLAGYRKGLREISDPDAIWLAAAIDAEGCLMFKVKGDHGRIHARLVVTNTNKDFVEKAATIMHAKISSQNPRDNGVICGKLPIFFAVTAHRDNVERILRRVTPHLIIKRAKAAILLQWYDKNLPFNPADEARIQWERKTPEQKAKIIAMLTKNKKPAFIGPGRFLKEAKP